MHYFITGARGFVMSVLVKELLTEPDTIVTAVDLHPPDDALMSYLAAEGGRVRFAQADVTDPELVTELVTAAAPDVIIHGATVTHDPETEHRDPARFIRTNVGGLTNVLDAARHTESVQRILLISSGAVYGSSPETELTEESTPAPDEMYGISKVASELIAQRFSQLYNLHIPIARLTKMFGPMERPSSGRAAMSLPYHLARAAVQNQPVTLTSRTMQAGGDWLSATQTAKALHLLATDNGQGSRIYNISSGVRTSVSQLTELFDVEVLEGQAEEGAAADMDPDAESGKNGVYISKRAQTELSWTPADIKDQVAEYVDWTRQYPNFFSADS